MYKNYLFLRNVAAAVACLAATATFFSGCDPEDDPTQDVEATGVALDYTTLTLEVGKTAILTATITPSDATDKSLTWMSANSKVAVVDNKGVVEATGAGSTDVTVETANGLTATCKVTVTEAGVSTTGGFQKKTFDGVADYFNFMPVGTFLCQSVGSGSYDRLYAKCADGSLTSAEIANETDYFPGAVDDYQIWRGSNYYHVYYDTDEKAFYRSEGNFTAEHTLEETKLVGKVNPGGAYATLHGAPTYVNPLNGLVASRFFSFITSDACEKAVFEKNETVAGIACKKYVLNGEAWWVLENGFCLKNVSAYGTTYFEVIEGELGTKDYNTVLMKYYKDPAAVSIVPLESMPSLLHLKDDAWIGGAANVIPWTASELDYSVAAGNFKDGIIEWNIVTYYTEENIAALPAYEAKVLQIPDMLVTKDTDETLIGYRTIHWEADTNICFRGGPDPHKLGEVYHYIKYYIYASQMTTKNLSINISLGKVIHV
jgi:hypothetical protein